MSAPAAWVLDLDGVIWLGDTPIEGAAQACAALSAAGTPPVFVTNMSKLTVVDQEAKLARHGIDATGRVATSAQAAARCCTPGERAYVLGGAGIDEALSFRGVEVVADHRVADVVVVGMTPSFDYEQLSRASAAIRSGARFVATNLDPTYPTAEGLRPGAGALVSAVETASGSRCVAAGKPNAPMAEVVRDLIGTEGIVVGDRADTDGEFARTLGFDFGLVLSGSTALEDLPVSPEPVIVAADLGALVAQLLG